MKQLIIRILRLLRIYKDPEPEQTNNPEQQPATTVTEKAPEPNGQKTLHALLIAIDKYPIAHHRLNGCVNDRNAFQAFLERRFDQEEIAFNIKLLTDEEATKEGIIKSFQHFRSARDGDICVFYYSGHGSRANSPKEFWHLDTDKMNESVVCYDSRIANGKDLMDKELSYLFWDASWNHEENRFKDIHLAAIFDCCHSGTISRNLQPPSEEGVTERMAEPSPTPNRLEDYFGFERYKKEFNGELVEVSPPSGRFIQIAASKEDETAKELRINNVTRGIFTYNLIEVLEQTSGLLTYSDLVSIMQVRVAGRVSKQTPQLESEDPALRNSFFLGGQYRPLAPHYNLNFQGGQWIIDAGQIHGIPQAGGLIKIDKETAGLEEDKFISISQVEANRSILEAVDGLDTNRPYKAYAHGINFNRFKTAIITKQFDDASLKMIREAFKNKAPFYLELVEQEKNADYLIKNYKNHLILTRPGEEAPLFKRVSMTDEQMVSAFIEQADDVANWKNLLDLQNGHSSIDVEEELEIKFYRITEAGNLNDSAPKEELDWRDDSLFPYQFKDNEWHQPSFQLSIRNIGTRKLYISALNMQADFKISNRFLPFKEMSPGDEAAFLIDAVGSDRFKTIPLELPDAYLTWGITEIKEYVKFIISTDPNLRTDQYEQEALELDVREDFTTKAGREQNKSPRGHDWVAKEVKFTIVRPMKSYKLTAAQPTRLIEGFSIEVPGGVQGEVALMGLNEAERAVSGQLENSSATRSLEGQNTSTYDLWGFDQESEVFSFTEKENAPGLSALELTLDHESEQKINQDNPIKIKLDQKPSDHEFIVPMGYDEETGMYYALGGTNEDGDIIVENLPQPTASRSLGRSLKLFFHKIIFKPLGFDYNWPRLAMAQFKEGTEEEFDYITDQDKVREAIANASSIVMTIHGIIGNTKLMTQSLKRLNNEDGSAYDLPYDLILTFDYENLDTSIATTAKDLKRKLEEVGLGDHHNKAFTILAHSMGGLVSRYFIEKLDGSAVVSNLIMCGTPNNGSPWANAKEMASILLTYVLNGAAPLKAYTLPLMILQRLSKKLFTTLDEMHAGSSKILKELNNGSDPEVPYYVVMGNALMKGIENQEKEKRLIAKVANRFVDFTYQALETFLFGQSNDIAVSEESATLLKNANQWKASPGTDIVACDHLSYFSDIDGLKGLKKAVETSAS